MRPGCLAIAVSVLLSRLHIASSCDRAFYASIFSVQPDAPVVERFLRYNQLHRRNTVHAENQRFVIISIDTTEDGPNDGGDLRYASPLVLSQFTTVAI